MPPPLSQLNRRKFLQGAACAATLSALGKSLLAQSLQPLRIASAGSMRTILTGPIATAAQALGLALDIHAEGADTVARALADGSLPADVFISVTASPMRTVIQADKIHSATSIAGTELVWVYSPASRFASQFQAAAQDSAEWWQILQQPGLRIGRGDPSKDPGARAFLFCLMLAAKRYNQPNLLQSIAGSPMNDQQIVPNVAQKLKSGDLDASTAYRINTGSLPCITLPEDINLSRPDVQTTHPDLHLEIAGKLFSPEPLVFFAGQLEGAQNPSGATRFLQWLQSSEAQSIFATQGFTPVKNVLL